MATQRQYQKWAEGEIATLYGQKRELEAEVLRLGQRNGELAVDKFALEDRVKVLEGALEDANQICRSACKIAQRIVDEYGPGYAGTNFGAFRDRTYESLVRQWAVMHPLGGDAPTTFGQSGASSQPRAGVQEQQQTDGERKTFMAGYWSHYKADMTKEQHDEIQNEADREYAEWLKWRETPPELCEDAAIEGGNKANG